MHSTKKIKKKNNYYRHQHLLMLALKPNVRVCIKCISNVAQKGCENCNFEQVTLCVCIAIIAGLAIAVCRAVARYYPGSCMPRTHSQHRMRKGHVQNQQLAQQMFQLAPDPDVEVSYPPRAPICTSSSSD